MEVRRSVTVDETVDLLNKLLEIDRKAVSKLFSLRVPCSEKFIDHKETCTESGSVGLLGLLNSLFGPLDSGPEGSKGGWFQIMMYSEDVPNTERFSANNPTTTRIIHFGKTEDFLKDVKQGEPVQKENGDIELTKPEGTEIDKLARRHE